MKNKQVRVTVPATSANLAVGYDVMALALDLVNVFELSISSNTSFEGFDPMYQNKYNLVYQSYLNTLKKVHVEPHQLNIVLKQSNIPVSRGLGSSASCVLAGVFGANSLHDLNLSRSEMLKIASEIEGHADNAAAALYGGLVSVVHDHDSLNVFSHEVDKTLDFHLVIPPFRGSTRQLREVVPHKISVQDTVFHIERALLLSTAFAQGDFDLLKTVLQDKIHQTKRLEVYGLLDLFDALNDLESITTLSGSGSSLLVIHKDAVDLASIVPSEYEIKAVSIYASATCEVIS